MCLRRGVRNKNNQAIDGIKNKRRNVAPTNVRSFRAARGGIQFLRRNQEIEILARASIRNSTRTSNNKELAGSLEPNWEISQLPW